MRHSRRTPAIITCLLVGLLRCCPDALASSAGAHSHLLDTILRNEPNRHLQDLAKFSDDPNSLARTFFSPAHKAAAVQLKQWMEEAGMKSWIDVVGNVHGRIDGANPDVPAVVLGSHYDTVLDGGKYDGALGIIVGIAAIKAALYESAVKAGIDVPAPADGADVALSAAAVAAGSALFSTPVHLVAFTDEEGVRFQSTFLGSRAVAGTLMHHGMLFATDKEGRSLEDVLRAEGGITGSVEEAVSQISLPADKIAEYMEVHVEQGPVLEAREQPLGVVAGIAGQTRLWMIINGTQGHAGTVPMFGRKDPLAAAAAVVTLIESTCGGGPEAKEESSDMLVCTVGELRVWPGASNVIPGQTQLSIDIRAQRDELREDIVSRVWHGALDECTRRGVSCELRRTHDAAAVQSDAGMVERAKRAILKSRPRVLGGGGDGGEELTVESVPVLVSGAGHDGLAMAEVTKIAMMFVRCRGGVSHSPLEHTEPADTAAATAALAEYLTDRLTAEETLREEL